MISAKTKIHFGIYAASLWLANLIPLTTNASSHNAISNPPFQNVRGLFTSLESIRDWVASVFVVLAVILFIYSAYLFLTAGDNEDQISKAKRTLLWALIGVAISLFAYGIFSFVRSFLTERPV